MQAAATAADPIAKARQNAMLCHSPGDAAGVASRVSMRPQVSGDGVTGATAAAVVARTATASSIGSMRRLTAEARSRSIARLRAIATIQVIGLARAGSKAAALRHTVR